jgi:hypothetical protein
MKKFAVLAIAALVSASAFADDLGGAAINVNDTWYKANGWDSGFDFCTGGQFGAESLGEIYSLTLGGQIQFWGSLTGDGISGQLGYKFDSDESSVNFLDLNWGWTDGGNGNQVWQTGGADFTGTSIDISGLSDGEHTLSVWFKGSNGSGDQYDSNGNNNYVATFTKATAVPEPATMSLLGLGALAMVIRRKLSK